MKAFLLIAFIAFAYAACDALADATKCETDPAGCVWLYNACTQCEEQYEERCDLAKNCFWGKDRNQGTDEVMKEKCYSNTCEHMEDEGTCIDAIGCGYLKEFWAVEPGPACKKCSEMNANKSTCVRFNGCKFDDATNLCVSKKIEETTCDEITESNKCERAFHLVAGKGCEWTKDGTCVDFDPKGPTAFCEKFNGDTCPASCRRGWDGETTFCDSCSSVVEADFETKCISKYGCAVSPWLDCEPITSPTRCSDKEDKYTCEKNKEDVTTPCSWCEEDAENVPDARRGKCYDKTNVMWCVADPEIKAMCNVKTTPEACFGKNENDQNCYWCPLTSTCTEYDCLRCKDMYSKDTCKKVKVDTPEENVRPQDNVDCLWCEINSYCIDEADTTSTPKIDGCYESCELATYAQCETADQAKGHCKGCKFDEYCTERTTREPVCTIESDCDGKDKETCTADENSKCQWCEENATSKANYCTPAVVTCDYKCSAVMTKAACDSRDDKCAFCKFDNYCGDKGAKCTITCDKQTDEAMCKAETSCKWQEDKADATKSKCVQNTDTFECDGKAKATCTVGGGEDKCKWCKESVTADGKADYCAAKTATCDYKCSAAKTKAVCDSRNDECVFCEFDGYCGDKGAKCTVTCADQKDEAKCTKEASCEWQKDAADAAKSKCVKSAAARVVASAVAFAVVAIALLL